MEVLYFIGEVLASVTKSLFRNLLFFLPRPYKDITGDVILITGGGRGIGRLIAMEFAKLKPKQIILWGRHEDTLSATARAVELKGVSCAYMVCDVSKKEQVISKSDELKRRFSGIDILVNNAGVVNGGSVTSIPLDDFQDTVNVNLMAQFWTTRAFLPYMLERNHGHIVSINSMLGLIGLADAPDYNASKFGALGFHEALAMEVSRDSKNGVFVSTIHPYQIDTELFAGVQSRFPALFPPLDKNYAAWKIVNAVCTNQEFCIIPRSMYFFFYLKCILPYETLLILQRFLHLDTAMRGRHGYSDNRLAGDTSHRGNAVDSLAATKFK